MKFLVCFLLLLVLVCVNGRGGGFRIRFSSRSFGRTGGRSGGARSGGRSSSSARPRGKGGWFSSSGTQASSRSGSSYPRVYSHKSYSQTRKDINKEREKTNFGTKFGYKKVPTSKKMFGLGVGAGFLGGSGYGYGASLASYTIYHRYIFLMAMLHSNGYRSRWNTGYHSQYYERNKCFEGCHPWAHCEWGICECNAGFDKMWGRCTKKNDTQPTIIRSDTGSTGILPSCTTSEDCWKFDINLVCETGTRACRCREDMAWNPKQLECQIFLDVDCKEFNEERWPSQLVQQAANRGREEEKARVRKIQEEKCQNAKKKCVDMDCKKKADIKSKIESHIKMLGKKIKEEEIVQEKRWKEAMCDDQDCMAKVDLRWNQFLAEANCSKLNVEIIGHGVKTFPGKCGVHSFGFMNRLYGDTRCKGIEADRVMYKGFYWMTKVKKCSDQWCEARVNGNCDRYCKGKVGYVTPEKRTETKNESLATSLLIHIKDDKPKEKDLVEAFCRDIDSFNLAFQEPDVVWRPSEKCQPVPTTSCAVVYDSHDCYAGWSRNITDGTQENLSWAQSNDIDTIGVRAGCTFTGFSEDGYDGTIVSISAGLTEKWVVLAKEEKFKDMDENIESIQCICR